MRGTWRLFTLLSVMSLLTAVSAGPAAADAEAAEYDFLIGTGFLCGLAPSACPDVTAASNGDTVDITGSGTVMTHPKSVTGAGTFVHHFAGGGSVSGTWQATQLVSFNGYGCEDVGGGTIVCGGLAIIRVDLSVGGAVVGSGVLQVDCLIGSFPSGGKEGVRLNAHGVFGGINFNREVSGFTVFVP